MLILFYVLYFILKIQKEMGKSKIAYSEIVSNLKESLTVIKMVQAFAIEDRMISKFSGDINLFVKTMDKRFQLESKMKYKPGFATNAEIEKLCSNMIISL